MSFNKEGLTVGAVAKELGLVEQMELSRLRAENVRLKQECAILKKASEIERMSLPAFQGEITDYRLSRNPFFFKFVKRKIVADSHQSFLVSLDHLKQVLASPEAKGPKGGIRLSYDALDGTYLREADMISLIRSGYVGTHRAETEALATIISNVAEGDRALVLAWQTKTSEKAQLKVTT